MIPFNRPAYTGSEIKYIRRAIERRKLSGDGEFTDKCSEWFKRHFGCKKALLTTSGSHALEMAAFLSGVKEGDEVIMPSYTFPSTANAFVLRGGRIVFIDIRPDTMNLDEKLVQKAVTGKTKVIVAVHYGGISCEMDTILNVAGQNNIMVIEDAAQAMMSTYKSRFVGTIGSIGCYSFHESKNYNCGEGGAIILNDEKFIDRAEVIREKGTDRSKFFRGLVDKYSWVDVGSSYLPSELNAAYLYAQLEKSDEINEDRLQKWDFYHERLKSLAEKGHIELPVVPEECRHNGHMFYIKVKGKGERKHLLDYLEKNGISAVFHYLPLHTSGAGRTFGRFSGQDRFTTRESERLLRLPMYYGLLKKDIAKITGCIERFYTAKR
jgi:dTDP-4-amino-4,6-dideoxygalactose transaminase